MVAWVAMRSEWLVAVAGLAVVRFEGSLAKAATGAGYLEAFLTPSDL